MNYSEPRTEHVEFKVDGIKNERFGAKPVMASFIRTGYLPRNLNASIDELWLT